MATEDIGVRLVIENLSGFLSGMDKYNASLEKAEKRTQKFAERAGKAGRSLTIIAAPLIALGALSARSAISFETAFIGVQKTVDATVAEFEQLEAAIRQMAQEVPVTVEEFSALAETAGQLGIEIGDIQSFIRVVADLGVATNLTAERAAVSLARLVTITGLSQEDFDRLGATIVALGNNFAATEEEILTFGLRIASAGAIAGLTEAQILSIGTAMSAVGIQAQAGGTAVQRVLLNMTEAVATGSEKLEVFAETAGLSAEEFADVFERDAGQAFTRFVEGLGSAGDEAFIILRKLGLEDQRLLRSFLSLAAAGDLLSQSMTLGTKAFAENTALVQEAEKRYASAASQISIARGEMNELFITIGEALVPVLLELVNILKPILGVLARLAGRFPLVTVVVIGLATAVGILGIALLGLSFILPGLVFLFPALAGGISLAAIATFALAVASGVLAIALSPITLIVVGIAAAVVGVILIFKHWSTIVDAVTIAVRFLIDVLKQAVILWLKFNPVFAGLRFASRLIPGLPSFQTGGIQQTSGPAVVGERGPELVNLPAGSQVSPVSGPTTTNFNVTANYTNPQDPQTIRLDLEALNMMTRA